MNTRNRRGSKLALSILGLAAAVPLLAVSASAGLEGGNFLIRATNADNMSGTAGIGGVGTPGNPGGNPGGPGEGEGPGTGPTEPEAVALATYSCGPASIEITDRMVELSKSNEALFAAGKADETVAHADGWKVISGTYTGAFQSFPTEGTMPAQVRLATTTTGTALAYRGPYGTGCVLLDNRADGEGETYYYANGYGSVFEGRNIVEEGQLRQVRVTDSASETTVTRTVPSNRYPTKVSLLKDTNDLKTVVSLPEKRDGTDRIYVEAQGDGSMFYRYMASVPGQSMDAKSPTRSEPTFIWLYDTGLIRTISYNDQNGVEQSYMPSESTYAAQVAGYNARSGQSWDGNLIKISDLETGFPFMPTAP